MLRREKAGAVRWIQRNQSLLLMGKAEHFFEVVENFWVNAAPQQGTSKITSAISGRTRSFVRSLASRGKWLRRAIWVWPIIAAIVLAVIGLFLRNAVEHRLRDDTASRMQTILQADVAALRMWMQSQQKTVQSIAVDSTLVASTEKLTAIAATTGVSQLELLQSPALKSLRDQLTPFFEAGGYIGWIIVTPQSADHCFGTE